MENEQPLEQAAAAVPHSLDRSTVASLSTEQTKIYPNFHDMTELSAHDILSEDTEPHCGRSA
jgi:hypothetical protein